MQERIVHEHRESSVTRDIILFHSNFTIMANQRQTDRHFANYTVTTTIAAAIDEEARVI